MTQWMQVCLRLFQQQNNLNPTDEQDDNAPMRSVLDSCNHIQPRTTQSGYFDVGSVLLGNELHLVELSNCCHSLVLKHGWAFGKLKHCLAA